MSRFLRAHLQKAPSYVPGEQRTGTLVKLNTNECPYPPSPKALAAIQAASERLMRYPPPDADDARIALARRMNVSPDNVIVCNGSDETLRLVFQAYLEPGDPVAWSTPTYTLYKVLADFSAARIVDVPRRNDFSIDVNALAAAKAKLTVVATPNSPTGTVTPEADLRALAGAVPLLCIDEAYTDFAGVTAAGLVKDRDNVIVCRTLSKSYSLAGLRVGFAIAHKAIIEDLLKLKDSYNVGMLANAGAAAAIDDDAYARSIQARIVATRSRLETSLRGLGWRVHPSGSNFLFAQPPDNQGARAYEFLRDRGILVRWFGDDPRTAAGIRITIGTDPEIDRLLEALQGYAR